MPGLATKYGDLVEKFPEEGESFDHVGKFPLDVLGTAAGLTEKLAILPDSRA